jgi:hypothetical protein
MIGVKAGTQLKSEVQEFKRLRILEEAREHVGISRSLAALDEALASGLAPREMLRLIVEQVTSIVIAHQKYLVVYLREEKNLEAKEAKHLVELRKEFGVRLAKLLEAGTHAKVFDVDDALLTAVSIGGMITWTSTWFRARGHWSQSEVTLHMVKKVERMVLRVG